MNRIIKRLAVPLSAAAVLGTAGFAYMAGNTVPDTNAGAGAATISGYTVSNVHYTVHDHGIAHEQASASVSAVTFDLAADNPGSGLPPTTLWAVLTTTDPTSSNHWARFDTCAVVGNPGSTTRYTCSFTPVTTNPAVMSVEPLVSKVKSLEVTAAS